MYRFFCIASSYELEGDYILNSNVEKIIYTTISLIYFLLYVVYNKLKGQKVITLDLLGILLLMFGFHLVLKSEFFPIPVQDRVLQSGVHKVENYYYIFDEFISWYELCTSMKEFFALLCAILLLNIQEIVVLELGIYVVTKSKAEFFKCSVAVAIYFEILQWGIGKVLGCNYMVVAFDDIIMYIMAFLIIFSILELLFLFINRMKLREKSDILNWIYCFFHFNKGGD